MKRLLAVMAMMLYALLAHAAVDVNKANVADLDGLKGVGPALSQRILDARKQGEFKNWDDLMARVKGIKEKTAAKLSAEGLTVNGVPYPQAGKPPAPAAAPKAVTK